MLICYPCLTRNFVVTGNAFIRPGSAKANYVTCHVCQRLTLCSHESKKRLIKKPKPGYFDDHYSHPHIQATL